jgi:hypothetical protein
VKEASLGDRALIALRTARLTDGQHKPSQGREAGRQRLKVFKEQARPIVSEKANRGLEE